MSSERYSGEANKEFRNSDHADGSSSDRHSHLARISHTKKAHKGWRISESCFARTTFARFEERPRCKQSVARNCSHLHLSAAAKLWAVLTAERSRQTPELCCCGRRIERSGWSNALASASSTIATRS